MQIDRMHAVRRIRESWDDLTPEGVKLYATAAYGEKRAMAYVDRKVMEKMIRGQGQ